MSLSANGYIVHRSQRKSISLEITGDLRIIVRAPMFMSKHAIDDFVVSHDKWIKAGLERQRNFINRYPPLSDKEIAILKRQAKIVLPEKTAKYAEIMGVHPAGIKITSAKTRLGSCSSKGNICYSWRLMRYDDKVIDYVVVHELAHLLHMNHSQEFYHEIEKILPDWRERVKALKH